MESKVFYYKSQLAVTLPFLISEVYGEDGSDNKSAMMCYYNDVRAGKLQVLRRGGGLGNPALICYENMPDEYKIKIQKSIPDGDVMHEAQRNEVQALLEHNEAISNFYSDFEVEYGVKLPPQKAVEYYNNAIVMVGVGKVYSEKSFTKNK
ncbi:MAG: hypothetical protein LBB53_01175 [Prevotellaceae bacterium]|jgi:hypothetical protein|nr:hypothetical protein [Prevotellaceae bacterium]